MLPLYTRGLYSSKHQNCCIVLFSGFLQTFYTEKFGPGVVEIVKDSNSVEHDRLSPNKV